MQLFIILRIEFENLNSITHIEKMDIIALL